jgi:predicted RNA binding protein YcfA (HicA-like mRNA interferase family)
MNSRPGGLPAARSMPAGARGYAGVRLPTHQPSPPAARVLHARSTSPWLATELSQGMPTVGTMPPLPRITGREVVRALGKLGWVVVIQKGSHAQLKRPDGGGRVTVPLHAGETLGPGLLRSILNQAGITADELRAVL